MSSIKTCDSCRCSMKVPTPIQPGIQQPTMYQCHKGPPTVHPIIAMTPQGPQLLGNVTAWPDVKPKDWCEEWKAKMVV